MLARAKRVFPWVLLQAWVSAGCQLDQWTKILESSSANPRVLKGPDGRSQILVPENWKREDNLHEDSDLGAADRRRELYLVVLTESKEDFEGMSVEKHSELTRSSLLKSLRSPQISKPTELIINGKPAVQYEIRGTINNLNIVYLHTTAEDAKNYHQILAWTLRSRFEQNKAELQRAIKSFQSLP